MEDDTIPDPLLTALEDTSSWIRSVAAYVLGLKKHALVTDRLLEHLARDVNEYVRLRCAWAIGQIKDSTALWRLVHLRQLDRIYCVRFVITDAIAQLDPAKAIELLLADLKHDNPSIRLFGAEDFRKVHWPEDTDLDVARKTLGALQATEPFLSIRRTAAISLVQLLDIEP